MLPIATLKPQDIRNLRFILFDIDDTITEDGLLLPESYDAMWRLHKAGFAVVPVTGRPAGWCDLIARQWPVSGVVGENGAFALYMESGHLKQLYHPAAPEPGANQLRLQDLGSRARVRFPGLRLAKDQPYRLFDVALDFAEEKPDLGLELARQVKAWCETEGAVAKVSSIHVNAWFGNYDKLGMAELFLSKVLGYDPDRDLSSVLYFGDSPNDEPMFGHFPLSCGVANVTKYADMMVHPPKYVTQRPFGYGYAEGVSVLLNLMEKR